MFGRRSGRHACLWSRNHGHRFWLYSYGMPSRQYGYPGQSDGYPNLCQQTDDCGKCGILDNLNPLQKPTYAHHIERQRYQRLPGPNLRALLHLRRQPWHGTEDSSFCPGDELFELPRLKRWPCWLCRVQICQQLLYAYIVSDDISDNQCLPIGIGLDFQWLRAETPALHGNCRKLPSSLKY